MRTGTYSLALFVLNVAPVVCIASLVWTGGLTFEFSASACVIDISDIIVHSFELEKSSSISQLINDKSINLQKLLKYFNGTRTSVFNLLLPFGALPIIFVLYSEDLIVIVSSLFILLPSLLFSIAESFIWSL